MPLLAIKEEIEKRGVEAQYLWLGTRKGPEKELVEAEKIKFEPIVAAKWRRYFSLKNIFTPFLLLIAFAQSLLKIFQFNPDVILTAGSFVAVPVAWAGKLFSKKIVVHQQDWQKGLANKLMAPLADLITVTFKESLESFPAKKVYWTGNPVRGNFLAGNKEAAIKKFNLEKNLPTLLIMGGGTGALALNKIVAESLPELVKFCQIIHLSGEGKKIDVYDERYHPFEFLTGDYKHAFAAADLVVCRAGLGTLTELAHLNKPAIVIPLPGTHQEDNVDYFARKKSVLVISQDCLTAPVLVEKVKKLLFNETEKRELSDNLEKVMKVGAEKEIVDLILKLKTKNEKVKITA